MCSSDLPAGCRIAALLVLSPRTSKTSLGGLVVIGTRDVRSRGRLWRHGAASSRRYSLATTSDRFSVASLCATCMPRSSQRSDSVTGTTLAASCRIASVPINELEHAPVELQLSAVCGSQGGTCREGDSSDDLTALTTSAEYSRMRRDVAGAALVIRSQA